jgi:hypothetical protein
MSIVRWRRRIKPPTVEDVAGLSPDKRTEIKARVSEQRTRSLSSVFNSVVVLAGVIFSAVTVLNAVDTLKSTKEEQYTGRYAKAIEELGNKDSVDVRLGGIFALENLVTHSPRDYGDTATQVLAAYVRTHIREHAHRPPGGNRPMPSADVRAALEALGHCPYDPENPKKCYEDKDLWRLDADGLDLQRMNFANTYLVDAHLSNSKLTDANLNGANLSYANLSKATLPGVYLRSADLSYAILANVNLVKGSLNKAILRQANLKNANLKGVDLSGADLLGADLSGADLSGAKGIKPDHLRQIAKTDGRTRF